MKCPKCGSEVADNEKICPHCKKVLKLVCPKCGTVNSSSTCSHCGFVILSKCEKCGTITPTIKGKCSKCGFSTYQSVAMASSNINEFACLTIDFANLDDIKEVLGSKRLIEKFTSNLDSLVKDFCTVKELKCEIIDGLYVIKFNKDDSFTESALNAMSTTLELAKDIVFLNFKMSKAKAISVECKMALLKRSVETMPEDFKSGFNIKLVSNYSKDLRYLSYFQIITDSNIYQEVCDDYSLNSLNSSYIKGEMVTFFELNLKKHLKVEPPKEEVEELPVNLAQIEEIKEVLFDEHEELENKLYNKDVISFDDMKCSFLYSNAFDIDKLVHEEITKNHKKIIMIKSDQQYKPDAHKIFEYLETQKTFIKSYYVPCYENIKYKPYGFFYELVSVMNELTRVPKLFSTNNLTDVGLVDQKGLLNSIVNMNEYKTTKPEESRALFVDIITRLLKSQKNTLIYIDNFEMLDESSYEILKEIWKNKSLNVTFIISSDIEMTLHKTAHFLFQDKTYSEVRLKPLSIKHIVEANPKKYSTFSTSYYFTAILQTMKGSYIFFENALSYLEESDITETDKGGTINVISNKACVIPNSLESLLLRRIQKLSRNTESFKLLSVLTMLSPMNTFRTTQLLGLQNPNDALKYLVTNKYVTLNKNNIYINNYFTLKKVFDKVLKPDEKIELANEILSKFYSGTSRTAEELTLLNLVGNIKEEQKVLENLSALTYSVGDFTAYLNCTNALIKFIEQNQSNDGEDVIENYKQKVYENVSKLLSNYTPQKLYGISKNIFSNLEKSNDISKIISFSIKILKSAILSGNYGYTLEIVNKVLAKLHNYSINPNAVNFDVSYFVITLIRIEALFSVGRLRECEELGNEIVLYLKSPKISTLESENISHSELIELIYKAMTFVAVSKVFMLRKADTIQEFINELKLAFGNNLPKQFDYLHALKSVMIGKEITEDLNTKNDEKFTKILKASLRAFTTDKEDSKKFANDIYEAKICANINNYSQLEIIFDLLIGYAYFKLGANEKAKSIYENVLEISDVNGYRLANYLACYFMSSLYYGINEVDIALELANNTVSHIEKDNNVGDYLFYLFRILTSGIYTEIGDDSAALACMQSAVFVKSKDSVQFGLEGVDIEVEERRVNDRRKVKEDYGGRRKGQRRITDDMKLLENFEDDNKDNKQEEDYKLLKDAPKEEKHSNNIFDDMKMLENLNLDIDNKTKEPENFKMSKEGPKEEVHKRGLSDDMKKIEEAQKLQNKKKQKEDELKEFANIGLSYKASADEKNISNKDFNIMKPKEEKKESDLKKVAGAKIKEVPKESNKKDNSHEFSG